MNRSVLLLANEGIVKADRHWQGIITARFMMATVFSTRYLCATIWAEDSLPDLGVHGLFTGMGERAEELGQGIPRYQERLKRGGRMEHAEAIKELVSFAEQTGRTLQNHRDQLQRHEEILHAQYNGGASHRDAIEVLRKDMLSLGELVNAQSVLLQSMQRTLLKIVTTLRLPPEEPLPGAVN